MRYILIIIIIFIKINSYSQNTFSYLGTLILTNNKPISFSLELQEKDGIVNGYSITNIKTNNETKSEISGLYFKSSKSFQLQETKILQTKSEAALNSFCYLSMNLSIKGKLVRKRLEGNFTGNFLDSIKCATGKIIMMERTKINKLINKLDTKKKETSFVIKTQVLKEEDSYKINWKSNKIKIFIWDANIEDGDKITLSINSNIILEDFETTNERKKIKYKLVEGENTIEIKATNLGKSPPNTSYIEMEDKNTKYQIITQLELGKTAVIKIIK
tara:strand:+ start:185 stop:1003 length:819 start_codon:yes stop_codon:yes gene_type:complete